MKTIRILAIGNSFSQDAAKFFSQTAKAAGVDVEITTLYIGGCPLERHWYNIETGEAAYQHELNGVITDRRISIPEAVKEENWDYIVTQQASHDSGWIESYEPFLGLITDYLRREAPNAKLMLQETWAYEPDSPHFNFMRYNRDQKLMYRKLHENYYAMAEKYGYDVIPCGTVIQKIREDENSPFNREKGGISICRDGFHMGWVYGRYLLACVWTRKLFGVSLKDNGFVPSRHGLEPADEKLLNAIRGYVDELI